MLWVLISVGNMLRVLISVGVENMLWVLISVGNTMYVVGIH